MLLLGKASIPCLAGEALAFKQGGDSFGSALWHALGALVLVGLLAVTMAVLVKRFLPGVRGYTSDGRKRVQLIETQRVTPKLTLLVIAYDGKEILLAQSGDQLLELRGGASGSSAAPRDTQDE